MEMMVAQRRLTHPVTDLTTITDTATVIAMQRRVLEVPVSKEIEDFILALVESTRTDPRLSLGASPRASIALYKGAQALASVRGRAEASVEDVRELAVPVLLKRIQVKSEQLLKGTTEQAVIAQLLKQAESRLEAAGARA